MTKSYHVFTSALLTPTTGLELVPSWVTASSRNITPPLPPATLDKAQHQISLPYQNAIFDGDDIEEEVSCVDRDAKQLTERSPPLPTKALVQPDVTNINDSRSFEKYDGDLTGDGMAMQSEGSSISHFPAFNFCINTLCSLSCVMQPLMPSTSPKVTLLLGILDVDGPTFVKAKTGGHLGSDICMLKFVVGDEHGAICKLVAWRETAERWGGLEMDPALTRGDIVLFENVLFAKAQITASPNLYSNAQLCYRTLPRTCEDNKWRPDLRLADSIHAVRKVAETVKWMEYMAGIASG